MLIETAQILRRIGPLTGLLLALLVAGVANAQSTVTDDEVNAVSSGLYCPVCESTPLDVCPTQACADWRELVRDQLASGMTEAEIHDYFALQYGDQVLAEPPRRGFSLFVWLLPILAVPVGAFLFVRYVRNIRQQDLPAAETTSTEQTRDNPDLESYIARVEAELTHE